MTQPYQDLISRLCRYFVMEGSQRCLVSFIGLDYEPSARENHERSDGTDEICVFCDECVTIRSLLCNVQFSL